NRPRDSTHAGKHGESAGRCVPPERPIAPWPAQEIGPRRTPSTGCTALRAPRKSAAGGLVASSSLSPSTVPSPWCRDVKHQRRPPAAGVPGPARKGKAMTNGTYVSGDACEWVTLLVATAIAVVILSARIEVKKGPGKGWSFWFTTKPTASTL